MALPLPSVVANVGPGGGIVTSMQGQNALTQSNLQNQILKGQAPYSGWNAYYDAMMKRAQSQFAFPQAIATMLGGPAAANLSPTQYQNLVGLMQQSMGNNSAAANSLGNNMPPPPNASGGSGMGLLSALFNRGGASNSNSGNNIAQMPDSPGNGPSNPMAAPAPNGSSANPVANMPSNPNAPALPFAKQAQGLASPGTMGGNNPTAGASATSSALTTGATTEAANVANDWASIHKEQTQQAQGAQNNLDFMNELETSFRKLEPYEKGPLFGRIPGITSEAQLFDRTKQNLSNSFADAQKNGDVTSFDRAAWDQMKPGRDLRDPAFIEQMDFMRAVQGRRIEKPRFFYQAEQKGYTPEQANLIWQYYISDRPIFDRTRGKIDDENLFTSQEFLEPSKVKEAFEPQTLKKLQVQQQKQIDDSVPYVHMLMPNNKGGYDDINVHPDDVQRAINEKHWKVAE